MKKKNIGEDMRQGKQWKKNKQEDSKELQSWIKEIFLW